MNQAQMRHAASIARHIREQAAERLVGDMESIEHFATEDEKYYSEYPVEKMVERIQNEVFFCQRQIERVLKDMLGELEQL